MTPSIGRRRILQVGVASALTATVGTSVRASAAGIRQRSAVSSDAVVSRYGMNVHANFLKSVYANQDAVITRLNDMGVRHVRTRIGRQPAAVEALREYAANGIQTLGIVGAFGDPEPAAEVMRTVREQFARPSAAFSGFEGINEPNNNGVAWIEETVRKTAELNKARAAYGLDTIPLAAPALARYGITMEGDTLSEQAANLGSAMTERGLPLQRANSHIYPGANPPDHGIAETNAAVSLATPDRVRAHCTEAGYFTAMDWSGSGTPVPAKLAAAYAPKLLLEHLRQGTDRMYRYQLLDPPGGAPRYDRESSWGLISTGATGHPSEWRPKPEYYVMRRLLRTFGDTRPFRPQPLAMRLRERPDDLRSMLFQRSNGDHYLALWLSRSFYSARTRKMTVKSVSDPVAEVLVELDSRKDLRVQDFATPAGGTRDLGRRRSARVTLNAGLTLVRVR